MGWNWTVSGSENIKINTRIQTMSYFRWNCYGSILGMEV